MKLEEIYLNHGELRIMVVKVGNRIIKLKAMSDSEIVEVPVSFYTEFQPPKKTITKRMAPALFKNVFEEDKILAPICISREIFESKLDAECFFTNRFIKFPAHDSLWCDVEVEGE